MPPNAFATGPGDIGPSDRTGRIGAMYVRGLLAQAGIRNEETSPGEDYGAVDVTVHLTHATVTAQVKTGIKKRNQDGTYSVSVTPEWCAKWAKQRVPVYLVFVALSKRHYCDLVTHGSYTTQWAAHAYWLQVNDALPGTVRVPVQNRLTLDTFVRWDDDILRAFTTGAA